MAYTHHSSTVKVIVYKLFQYFEGIANGSITNIAPNEKKTYLVNRIHAITEIPCTTLFDLIKTGDSSTKENLSDTFKRSKREFQAKKTGLNEEQLGQVRTLLYNFHISEGRIPTLEGLCGKVGLEMGIQMSKNSMRKVLCKLGFCFNKTQNNRIQLAEKK